jgi:hypothetical protein
MYCEAQRIGVDDVPTTALFQIDLRRVIQPPSRASNTNFAELMFQNP